MADRIPHIALPSKPAAPTPLRAPRHDLGKLEHEIEALVRECCTHLAEAVGVLEIVKMKFIEQGGRNADAS